MMVAVDVVMGVVVGVVMGVVVVAVWWRWWGVVVAGGTENSMMV